MAKTTWLAVALLSTALGGCIGASDGIGTSAIGTDATGALRSGDLAAPATEGIRWTGPMLRGPADHPAAGANVGLCIVSACPPEPEVECGPDNCATRVVEVTPSSDGAWVLEASVRWPTAQDLWYAIEIQDASGAAVAKGVHAFMFANAKVALLPDPAPGLYTVVVKAVSGEGEHEVVVQLDAVPAMDPVRPLLPDLVSLAPTDIQIRRPPVESLGYIPVLFPPVTDAFGMLTDAPGCTFEEATLLGAKRCLRFTNAVGNVGEGPLEIHLPLQSGAELATGARFIQHVYSSDGSHEAFEAGPAEFHAMHGHWHNAASNRYTVYAYDLDAGERGAEIGVGRKAGICFADIGLVELGLPRTAAPAYDGMGCINPKYAAEWWTGLSANWYDAYWYGLSEQFVDIGDAPDGVYELCTVTNQDGTLVESDATNNEACALFRLTGNDVEVLTEEPFHKARM